MAKVYSESHRFEWRIEVPVEVVWDYILDREAQVRLDPRIEAIEMESGQWGAPGSVMLLTAVGEDGKSAQVKHVLEAVVRPHFYRTRSQFPGVTLVTTVTTEADGDGTHLTSSTEIETGPVGFVARRLLSASRTKRDALAEVEASTAREAITAYAAERP